MALYDLSDKFQLAQAETYFNKLKESACVVELKKKMNRTIQQNKYLHLLLSWFASETGYSLEYVKTEFFKRTCNPQIFVVRVKGRMGSIEDLRSSADLSTKEMTTAIDRFRNWSASEAGIYLPAPGEDEYLKQIEIEISKKQEWL
jgi:hypothetical protein